MLAALSTLIDVIKQSSEPTPLGTQHFALLLAAWGPLSMFIPLCSSNRKAHTRLVIFGHLPGVRAYITDRIRFWR